MQYQVKEIDIKRLDLDPEAEYIQTELGAITVQKGRIHIIAATTEKVTTITPIKRNLKPITGLNTATIINPTRKANNTPIAPYF